MLVMATLVVIGSQQAFALGWANGITYYISGYSFNGRGWIPIYSSVSKSCSQQYYNFLNVERLNSIATRGWYQYNSSGAYRAALDNTGVTCY